MAQLENFRLKVFRVVAEHLNFRKAAEDLFLTQPAVTLQSKRWKMISACGSLTIPPARFR